MKIINYKSEILRKMNGLKNNAGFSLAEVVVTVAIAGGIFLVVLQFGQDIFSINSTAGANLNAQTDGRRVLKTMVKELRSTSPSSLGAYPIASVSTSSITFFSNIDSDANKEQIRYFLQGTTFKKGVTKPSGSPLTYNPANEVVSTLIRDIQPTTTPIFDYYDQNYSGTSSPLTFPINIPAVRHIRISVPIEKDINKLPGLIIVVSQVTLRNLKDNL